VVAKHENAETAFIAA